MLDETLSDLAEFAPTRGKEIVKGAKNLTGQQIMDFLSGKSTAPQVRREIGSYFGKGAMRFAGKNPIMKTLVRAVPGLTAAGLVMDGADVIAGDDGLGNKLADVGAMGLGGTIGLFMGGPLGAMVGASAGKSITDSAQAIFGGGKSEEERKMEELLAILGK